MIENRTKKIGVLHIEIVIFTVFKNFGYNLRMRESTFAIGNTLSIYNMGSVGIQVVQIGCNVWYQMYRSVQEETRAFVDTEVKC